MVREANLDEVRNQINEIRNFDVKGEVAKAVDPDGSLRRTVTEAGQSIQDATRGMDEPSHTPAPASEPVPSAEPAATNEAALAEPLPPPPLAPPGEELPAFLPPDPAPSVAPSPVPAAAASEPPPFVPPGTQRN
jgi:sec-independent protein translocase protein TatB